MGIYTNIIPQKLIDGKWVTMDIPELWIDPEIPHFYGKLDMMSDIDNEVGYSNTECLIAYRRQDFQSPGEFTVANEYAPWANRGYPEDADDELKELLSDPYPYSVSWVMLDELLGYDFDTMQVSNGVGEVFSWAEWLGPGYRIWYERLKGMGVERIIYGNH